MAGTENLSEEQISSVDDVVVDDNTNTESEKTERIVKLPLSRIKHMVKLDPDVTLASQDAVLMIAKATVSLSHQLSHVIVCLQTRLQIRSPYK